MGLRITAIGCIAGGLALVATGCGSGSSSPGTQVLVAHAKAGPFTAITFTADHDKPAAYAAPAGGTTEVVSALGTFKAAAATSEISTEQAAAASAGDQTLLVLNQSIKGAKESTLFIVVTGRPFKAAMNGLDVDAPAQHELVISVPENTDSRIAIADTDADSAPFVAGSLGMNADNFINNMFSANKSRIDLDADQNSDVDGKAADIYLSGLGTLAAVTMVNGAMAAQWTSPIAPTLVTCASLPASKWSGTLIQGGLSGLANAGTQYYFGIVSHGAWCVKSKQGRYGYLLQTEMSAQSSLNFQFVLWKKTSDY